MTIRLHFQPNKSPRRTYLRVHIVKEQPLRRKRPDRDDAVEEFTKPREDRRPSVRLNSPQITTRVDITQRQLVIEISAGDGTSRINFDSRTSRHARLPNKYGWNQKWRKNERDGQYCRHECSDPMGCRANRAAE